MEQTPSNISLEQVLSGMLTDVASEVPNHLNQDEEALLSIFLGTTKFTSLAYLLKDIESFLNEELDIKSINRENVSKVNFSALATKFGNRYGLTSLTKISNDKAGKLAELGWKTTRTIFIKVLRPQLQKIPITESQHLVMVLEEFICSYTIIQGESPSKVLDQLKFWEIFRDYQFTLEPDKVISEGYKKLPPPDEFIRWACEDYSVEQAGKVLAEKYKLISNKDQWVQFFRDHKQPVIVLPGQLNRLIAVLFQMENKCVIEKSKNKGCWKIWQEILVDPDGNPFRKKLRQTSSRINKEESSRDKNDYEFGKSVINYMMGVKQSNSLID